MTETPDIECPKCKTSNKYTNTFCSRCDAALHPEVKLDPTVTAAEPRFRKRTDY